jgi:hypothetical protein
MSKKGGIMADVTKTWGRKSKKRGGESKIIEEYKCIPEVIMLNLELHILYFPMFPLLLVQESTSLNNFKIIKYN